MWDQHLRSEPPSVREHQRESGVMVDCPEWLDELIRTLLAKKADDRPFNARAVEGVLLQHLLDEFGEEKSRELTRLDALGPTGVDPPETRTWVIWLAIAIAVAALVLLNQ